jgi:hypothetical protein
VIDAALPLPRVQRQIETEVGGLVKRYGSAKR